MNRGEPFAKMITVQMLIPHDAEVVFVKRVPILPKPLVVESASFPCRIEIGQLGKLSGLHSIRHLMCRL